MKFEFCGRVDCPEWVLSESAIVANLTPSNLEAILLLLTDRIKKSRDAKEIEEDLKKEISQTMTDQDA